ncbi:MULTISPECIES: protein phosphatase CheZ [unclassified Agarivorans]|uniref:protein phosphatase CheZ n=1 Tax=unclassified Agarivorans TaxID=2636026 RepID=UPI0026E27887|nr:MULTISPECIES: protein phosphatase CheZ [unclassified Agarivorans]MDO6686226.1 protein phosphatase CheZ [Agarivorans sp. 3_MG-2023]MDO6716325.1 protein phosphatase CheZ [Agarivorans sp. 2_MG-2023]
MSTDTPIISLADAKALVLLLEEGNVSEANQFVSELCAPKANLLFDKVGQLTRQLHDSLNDFKLDIRINELANQEIPDAKERLNYVIEMTDQAANKTMDAVESGLPIADQLTSEINNIMPVWQSLMERRIEIGQFKALCHQIDIFLNSSSANADKLRSMLTEILMAQDFQDLTGQMIRKVITLVQEVEESLVEMLTLFGNDKAEVIEKKAPAKSAIEAEGPILNKEQRDDVVNDQDDVDDLLSSLGF